MLSTILLYNIAITGQKRGRNMFGFKKSIYKTDSKNVKFDNREKYSDNHMPLTKNCFVDTSAIWNRGNNKLRASDEAQNRLLRFFDNQPSRAETKNLI